MYRWTLLWFWDLKIPSMNLKIPYIPKRIKPTKTGSWKFAHCLKFTHIIVWRKTKNIFKKKSKYSNCLLWIIIFKMTICGMLSRKTLKYSNKFLHFILILDLGDLLKTCYVNNFSHFSIWILYRHVCTVFSCRRKETAKEKFFNVHKLSHWLRYMDNTVVLILSNTDCYSLQPLVNSIAPSILFIFATENDNLQIFSWDWFSTIVFRKFFSISVPLRAFSDHPLKQKMTSFYIYV